MAQNDAARPSRAPVLQAASTLGLLSAGAGAPARVLSVLCNPDASGKDIAAEIDYQPALCAKVLRVANSAYYGQTRSVTTIHRALIVLGLGAVRTIAAAACVDRTFARRMEGTLNDMPALLDHSIATAVAAETIAQCTQGEAPAEAFIAGILHNLGIVVQACLDRTGLDALSRARAENPVQDIRALEHRVCEWPHEQCAAVIFEEWNLPGSLIAAVAYHHAPLEAPSEYRELAKLVQWGAGAALRAGHSFSLEFVDSTSNEGNHFGLSEGKLLETTNQIASRLRVLRSAFS